MPHNNHEWQDAWPKEPEATLLFKYVAHLHRQNIASALKQPLEGEQDIWPTPELDGRIEEAIKKARRRATWKKSKIVLRKAAAAAAIVIMCIAATPTVLFAISADFRETVYSFIVDWRQGHVDINLDGRFTAEQTFLKYYIPTFIPEGFVLKDYIDDDATFELHYVKSDNYFYFTTRDIASGFTFDTETANYDFSHVINGWPTIIRENRGRITIIWHDDVTSFSIVTDLALDTILKIASSYKLFESFESF